MAEPRLRLGPFDLHLRLRAGGMAEVWWGRHEGQRIPVAVKVLRREQAQDERYLATFRNEVRQIARLSHPNIVLILDHGVLPPDLEEQSEGQLRAGSPYLVMEYASQGSLRESLSDPDWSQTRQALRALLQALAHAHARGVMHRDLKPENVLCCGRSDLRPGYKLTDWGLAPLVGTRASGPGAASGTPRYMAPEQITGAAQEQGPWTDLYGLGVVAFELANGGPPFVYRTVRETLQAHLGAPVPPLEPRFAVPAGLEGWIRRLLAKDPRDRFRLAADALWALDALGEPQEPPAYDTSRDLDARAAPSVHAAGWRRGDASAATLQDAWGAEPDALTVAPIEVPTPAPDWRSTASEVAAIPPRLLGAGLSLYDLRPGPLVGREEERDRLWKTLRRVVGEGRARVALIRGGPGVGKSHLARWLAELAHEQGVMHDIRGSCSNVTGHVTALAYALAQGLGCAGADRALTQAAVERHLRLHNVDNEWEREALLRLLCPLGEARLDDETPASRLALSLRTLRRLSQERALLLWLDDAHLDAEPLALGEALLSAPRDLPVLLVLTLRDEIGERSGVDMDAVDLLGRQPRCEDLLLTPLTSPVLERLLRSRLDLEGHVSRMISHRSGGNPLFATQLLGDAVHRGLLMVGEQGFVLSQGGGTPLPDSLHRLWQLRLREALRDEPEAPDALALGAALGVEVDEEEWRSAAGRLKLTRVDPPLEALFQANLAIPRPRGWAWTHALLRESVLREAEARGRAGEIFRAAAATIGAQGSASAERLGRLLLAAGDATQSLDPLLEGVEERLRRSELHAARELLDEVDLALTRADLPPANPRWGTAALLRARVAIGLGQLQVADARAARLAEEARRQGWLDLLGPALRYRAIASQRLGDLQRSEALLLQAEDRAGERGDRLELARCALHRGTVLRLRGESRAAVGSLTLALSRAREAGDALCEADSLSELGSALVGLGEDAEAERALREALAAYERLRRPVGLGYCQNALGDLLRRRADPAAARAYGLAAELLEQAGSQAAIIPRLNLTILALREERLEDATPLLQTGLEVVRRAGRAGLSPYFHLGLMLVAAEREDWRTWDEHLVEVEPRLALIGALDWDLRWLIGRAASAASSRGATERARRLSTLAPTEGEP